MKKKNIIEYIAVIMTVVMFTATISFAWLSTRWEGDKAYDTVIFRSGDIKIPKMTMWIYDTESEGKDKADVGWRAAYSDSEDYVAAKKLTDFASESSGVITTEDGYLLSLQFGQVLSLVEETDENDIYFKFEVDGEELVDNGYATMEIDYHYVESDDDNYINGYVDVYSEQNDQIKIVKKTDDTDATALYNALYKEENNSLANNLIQGYYAISTNAYDMTNGDTDIASVKGLSWQSLSYDEDPVETVTLDQFVTPQNEKFYIYIKLSLDRTNLRNVLENLCSYMPCMLVFNAYIGLEPQLETTN